MINHKVDILLATYNGGQYLSPLINSILQQSYTDWRLLVHDDGSSDETSDILEQYQKEYPEKVVWINDGVVLGSAKDNFLHLLQYASSEYVMFCDQDDVWLKNKVELSCHEISRIEGEEGECVPVLVHTDLKVVDEDLNVISESFWDYQLIRPEVGDTFNRLLLQNTVTGCTVIANQEAVKLMHDVPREAIMHDWWMALIVASHGVIGHVDAQTIMYRQHGMNDTGAKKWNLFGKIAGLFSKNKRRNFKLGLKQNKAQAECFLKKFEGSLGAIHEQTLKCFLDSFHSGFFKRRLMLLKCRLLRIGFFRNLMLLIYF